jgi:choline monooxygenase
VRPSLREIIDAYDPNAPLERAWTIPSAWYTDPRVFELEQRTVFARSWQVVGRIDQVRTPGQFVAADVAAQEPVVVVRGQDGGLRAFFNVCRHHAAAVMTGEGLAHVLRCPYHGWTYGLDGTLAGTPEFMGVCDFDRAAHGLVPLDVAVKEQWVFVRVSREGLPADEFLGADLLNHLHALRLDGLQWFARREYSLACNWKVFVDNYLDGGYHVPFLHGALDSVLDYRRYTIENGGRFCLQRSPIDGPNDPPGDGAATGIAAVRKGQALYYWVYPNFMINWYEGVMDTNLVIPHGVDRTDVVFDFYFSDVSEQARARNEASIEVSERVQREDEDVCASVQRGLRSRAYDKGRLSVRREAGEHLFHRLLHADLQRAFDGRSSE